MKLSKTIFDRLDIGNKCIFKNDKGILIHCIKIDKDKIELYDNKEIHYTGMYHEVWKIEE